MKRKCEGCREGKPVAETQDGMQLCGPFLEACEHSDECRCPPCRKLKLAEEAIDVMFDAVKACFVLSCVAERKYGTWVVTGADVDRCDKAAVKALKNTHVLEIAKQKGATVTVLPRKEKAKKIGGGK